MNGQEKISYDYDWIPKSLQFSLQRTTNHIQTKDEVNLNGPTYIVNLINIYCIAWYDNDQIFYASDKLGSVDNQ